MITLLTPDQVRAALGIRDLTDPCQGPHALQILVAAIEAAPGAPVSRRRTSPVVPVADNYDRLGYPPDAAARDARHTRYITPELMLRAHTTAGVPTLLGELAADPPAEAALSCPGLCYRRDSIDRLHVGEPHQLDLWRIRTRGRPLTSADLDTMTARVLAAALPGRRWRTVPADHPYTRQGRQIDVRDGEDWVEVGECGLAEPGLLEASGLRGASGLAMGLGLDRLLMLRKGIADIRLLRSADPRVARQLQDLGPYEPVSTRPPVRRDLSLARPGPADAERLGDEARQALGPDARLVEELTVLAQTPHDELPEPARRRLGLPPGGVNILVRIVLRDLDRTLTAAEANRIRDRLAAALAVELGA